MAEGRFVCCICCSKTNPDERTPVSYSKLGAKHGATAINYQPSNQVKRPCCSWIQDEVDLSKPTMINLLWFQSGNETLIIPLAISDKAQEFCIHLLEDNDGSKFREIEAKHKNSYQGMNSETLERWLQGGGKQPVVWDVLIATLREIDMAVLAKGIERGVIKWKKKQKKAATQSLPSYFESSLII
jgi:hypothetical protein